MSLVYKRLAQGWNRQNVSANATYSQHGVIKYDVFQNLGAEILEKGKVIPNLLVTDFLNMKIPKDIGSSIFE